MPVVTRDNSKQEAEKEKRESKRWKISFGISVVAIIITVIAILK